MYIATLLLALVPGALAAPFPPTSYLLDPILQKYAAESHGALKPVTNFGGRGRGAPLTGPHGTSLGDFKRAAPRKNGPLLDATLIAMKMSDHNWPLARILTESGGVDVDNATVILTSRNDFNSDTPNGKVFPPLVVPVQRTNRRGDAPWWIDAYDQAVTEARNQNYGVLDDFFALFTGYLATRLSDQPRSRAVWKRFITTSMEDKSPIVIVTKAAPGGRLKAPHAYAIESIKPASPQVVYEQNDPYAIESVTLRDADTATRGVTYTWAQFAAQLYEVWLIDPYTGPGQENWDPPTHTRLPYPTGPPTATST